MSDFELLWQSALSLGSRLRNREFSAPELARLLLRGIEKFNPPLNAVVTIDEDLTLAQAEKAHKRIRAGDVIGLPLAGVPFLAKDLDITAGMRTTFGSRLHRDYVPSWDTFHVARMKAGGCVLLGKTNTPEDGTIPNTYNDLFGPTRNPWNPERCAGGSSGGSAAAVAAGLAPLATGSDGAGSIRLPASICGVFGIKPTFGTIPFGPKGIGVMNTIGHLGPLARHVADAAAMLDLMSGGDERDRVSLPKGESLLAALDRPFKVDRIAYSADLGYARVDPGIPNLFQHTIETLREDGWPLVEARPALPPPEKIQRAIETLVAIEWGTVPMQLGEKDPEAYAMQAAEVRELADLRRTLKLDDLWEAYETRKAVCMAMGAFFDQYDLLLTPALTGTAFELDRPWPRRADDLALEDRQLNWMLIPFNLTGGPACSVPMGLTPAGLPAGMQIAGPRHADARVLQAARLWEELSGFGFTRPPHGVGAGSN